VLDQFVVLHEEPVVDQLLGFVQPDRDDLGELLVGLRPVALEAVDGSGVDMWSSSSLASARPATR